MTADVITFKNVSFSYPEQKGSALKDVNFKVKKGDWFSIIGHNGSGKSTITKLINGLLVPKSGKIVVDGEILNEDNLWHIRNKVGIVFQNPDNQFVGATVQDDVAFGLENRGIPREEMLKIVPQTLNEVGMLSYAESEPSNLSGGQKQRVAIAGILAVKPQILILDEATSMLDPNGRKQILDLVKTEKEKNNLTVISVTHNIDETIFADEIMVLNDGQKVIQDKPTKVYAQQKLIEQSGLDTPFIFRLKKELEKQGISIPNNIDNSKKLSQFLCQLNSNM